MTIAVFTLRFLHDVTVCCFFYPSFVKDGVKKATSFFFSFASSDTLSWSVNQFDGDVFLVRFDY